MSRIKTTDLGRFITIGVALIAMLLLILMNYNYIDVEPVWALSPLWITAALQAFLSLVYYVLTYFKK